MCRLVQSTGLSIDEIKTRLKFIACQMDRVLGMLQVPDGGPAQAQPEVDAASGAASTPQVGKAIPVGASARRLSSCLRAGKLRCRCEVTLSG